MKYPTLLFDIDDTLLDFRANEAAALSRIFPAHGIELTDEVRQTYHAINGALWKKYEDGKATLREILDSRFADTASALGYEADGAEWEREYRVLLGEGHELIPGALELLSTLKATGRRIYAVTNGLHSTQAKRLEESGLAPYFIRVFTSEEIGYQKPSPEFFRFVAEHIPDFSPSETLIIGDSVSTDIRGGRAAGLATCLFSRSKMTGSGADYEISELSQLLTVLDLKVQDKN